MPVTWNRAVNKPVYAVASNPGNPVWLLFRSMEQIRDAWGMNALARRTWGVIPVASQWNRFRKSELGCDHSGKSVRPAIVSEPGNRET